MSRQRYENGTRRASLCWACRKATNSGCLWSRSLTPVEGWTAEEDHICTNYQDDISYLVMDCPEFIPDTDVRCGTCRYFEEHGEMALFGWCKANKHPTNRNGVCGNAKK